MTRRRAPRSGPASPTGSHGRSPVNSTTASSRSSVGRPGRRRGAWTPRPATSSTSTVTTSPCSGPAAPSPTSWPASSSSTTAPRPRRRHCRTPSSCAATSTSIASRPPSAATASCSAGSAWRSTSSSRSTQCPRISSCCAIVEPDVDLPQVSTPWTAYAFAGPDGEPAFWPAPRPEPVGERDRPRVARPHVRRALRTRPRSTSTRRPRRCSTPRSRPPPTPTSPPTRRRRHRCPTGPAVDGDRPVPGPPGAGAARPSRARAQRVGWSRRRRSTRALRRGRHARLPARCLRGARGRPLALAALAARPLRHRRRRRRGARRGVRRRGAHPARRR